MKKLLALMLFVSSICNATTWSEIEVVDPILPAAKCQVSSPSSYGSYIYNMPSKYEQVFWPYSSQMGIWHCKQSGFLALIDDFDDLTATEISDISNFLSESEIEPISLLSQLIQLEKIYAMREKTEEFRLHLKRVLAFLHEQDGRTELANEYRKQALQTIYKLSLTDLSEYKRLEYLYVSANYERHFGNAVKSDEQLAILASTIANVNDDELVNYIEYLKTLMEATKLIKEGGVLAPDIQD